MRGERLEPKRRPVYVRVAVFPGPKDDKMVTSPFSFYFRCVSNILTIGPGITPFTNRDQ